MHNKVYACRIKGETDHDRSGKRPPSASDPARNAAKRAGRRPWRTERENRSRDFSRGKPSHFILLGVLFTTLFVVVLLGVVKLILHLATG